MPNSSFIHTKNSIALVPGAGYLRDGLGRVIHKTPLFEIYHGKFVLELIIESLREAGFSRIAFAASEESSEFIPLAKIIFRRYLGAEIEIFTVKGGHDFFFSTLMHLVSNVKQHPDMPVALYLGDTVLNLPKPDSDLWTQNFYCVVELKHQDSRYQQTPNSQTKAAAGFYFWRHFNEFKRELIEKKDGNINLILDLYGSSIVQTFNIQSWVDLGNSAYQANFQSNMTPSRAFNTILVDEKKGIVLKKSSNLKKLKNEISFYKNLPNDLKYLFPRIFNLDEIGDDQETSVQMEFFPSRSLADIWFSNLNFHEVWEDIFSRIFEILNCEFSQFIQKDKVSFNKVVKENLIGRTQELIEVLQLENLISGKVKINGLLIRDFWLLVDEVLDWISDSDSSPNQIMHGDLCLSNILIEESTLLIRLIDPRGSFGSTSIFGSKLYDIAKLCHSVFGGYDHLVRDIFSLKQKDFDYDLVIPFSNGQRIVQKIFESKLVENGISYHKGILLSGLMLSSIPIFHMENWDRARAMFVRGIYQMELGLQSVSKMNQESNSRP